MPILAYGLNHRTADVDLRGQLAFAANDIPRALHSLRDSVSGLSEVAILSTCNRTEIHCAMENDSTAAVAAWLAKDRKCSEQVLRNNTYTFHKLDAVRHAIEIAAGLDSQVLGESQIFGQFKDAYALARTEGCLGKDLQLVENVAIQTAKKIRTQTEIGHNPVSVSYAAVKMIHQLFTDLSDIHVLLIGAGKNIQLLAEHVVARGVQKLTITNRTAERAEVLARQYNAHVLPFEHLATSLGKYDVVMSSTASIEPLLGKDAFTSAIQFRRRKAMLVVDIAIPRDIHPEVEELKDVYLYTVDDITGIVEQNLLKRQVAARQANNLLDEGVAHFQKESKLRRVNSLLRDFHYENEQTRADLLNTALQKIKAGDDAEEVMTRLTKELTNQLSHKPTMLIRHLGYNHTIQRINEIKDLFEQGSN